MPYGQINWRILDAIRYFARTEGLIADPVYEGRTILALLDLIRAQRLRRGHHVLVVHLGGAPAVHGCAAALGPVNLVPFADPHEDATEGGLFVDAGS